MFLRETVQHCSTCEEVTPHSRRVIAVPQVMSAFALVGAGWCFSQETAWRLPGGLLLMMASFCLLHDRERSWAIRCERCRSKKLRGLRRTKPTLGGHTEINLL